VSFDKSFKIFLSYYFESNIFNFSNFIFFNSKFDSALFIFKFLVNIFVIVNERIPSSIFVCSSFRNSVKAFPYPNFLSICQQLQADTRNLLLSLQLFVETLLAKGEHNLNRLLIVFPMDNPHQFFAALKLPN